MAKPKVVNFELIELSDKHVSEPYLILQEVRDKWHEDISSARIGLAWRKRTKADVDGHLVLGRCVKVSDLHKEFADYDFIIVLNKEIWNDPEFTREKKLALVDHELCHASISMDEKTGETKHDERGRTVFRTCKHDIEEFQAVVSRHGCYKRDLQIFAETLAKKHKTPTIPGLESSKTEQSTETLQ